jgi:hypothetical protein
LFPEETTVWQDANLISIKDPTPLERWCNNLLLTIHPFRTDSFEEANYCVKVKRGNPEDVAKQSVAYRGLPQGGGLYQTRVVVRKPTLMCSWVNDLWWEHILEYSSRDQVSLPYVLHLLDTKFNVVGQHELKPYFYKEGGHKFRGNCL